ncbi:MAG: ATP-binding protein [Bryobacteraceae bacterium]|jgi:heavy metal sensor kinase
MARFTRVFGVPKLRAHFLRGLRFRLAVSYVLFFAVLLGVVGLLFRQILRDELLSESRTTVDADWDATKGYLQIRHEEPVWVYDATDPEEDFIVERLRRVYLFTDSEGNVLQNSDIYASIGFDSPEEIGRILNLPNDADHNPGSEIHVRRDKDGTPYMIKAGAVLDEHKERYFLAIGRSLAPGYHTVDNTTRGYLLLMPVMLALACLFGWWLAGPAIRPVNDVAMAAQNITGANLSLQIPLRNAGDELDHLIESFNLMTARLNQNFEQIRRFSTDVSHELRTPLTAIRGQLEVALFTAETPEQYRDAIVNSLEAVEQLSSIVRALLLLSQAESGQVVLQKTALDLAEVATDIVDQFQIPAEEKGLSLTANLKQEVNILADRVQMERLLSNLLSNAVKYTPKGGSINVSARIDDAPGWVRLVVEDTGYGIPPENLPHIFDRFYRVRNAQTNAAQGLGLGLSFVAWIVEVHGGRIDVASTEGEGTRFTILLPSAASSVDVTATEPTVAAEPLA